MKREDKHFDGIFDKTIDGIRDETIDPDLADGAAKRVWTRIEGELATRTAVAPLTRCADYQALIPAHIAGALIEARALLLEDHAGSCVPCRKLLHQARAGAAGAGSPAKTPRAAQPRFFRREWSWAAAAALLVAVALFGVKIDFLGIEAGGIVTIKETDGEVFRVNQAGIVPVSAGDSVRLAKSGDQIRTARGATAVLALSDGSLVEMKERTELAVQERLSRISGERTDSTIELDRGSVIVEAADQSAGHLYVETDECKVGVTGTVFSVNHGIRGSRVSVIEGVVEVSGVRSEDVLRSGDQVASRPGIGRVPLEQEIAWSRNLDRHLALLHEMTGLGRELDRIVATPPRRSTTMLDRMPADTAVYVAIPNIGGVLDDAYRQIRTRIDGNPVLRDWWEQDVVASGADSRLDEAMLKIRDYGEHLGQEIVVTIQAGGSGEIHDPLVIAELARPDAFRDYLTEDLLRLQAAENGPNMVVLGGPVPAVEFETTPTRKDRFYIWIHDGLFAAGPELGSIERFAAGVASDAPGAFVGTAFHSRLAEAYGDGVEWVLGLDLDRIVRLADDPSAGEREIDVLDRMGLLDLQHLIVQHREFGDGAATSAVLSFDRARRGMASWLAEPAPMGALDFVSPGATMAAAFVIKRPALLLDDLFSFIAADDEDFNENLDRFQREHGVDIRANFVEPLGGEFAVALDGPVLPNPSWKLVLEIYDQAELQRSLEWAVGRLNELAAEHGKQGLRIEAEEVGARTFFAIRSLDTGVAAHYTFVDGYLVATPSRVLLDRALKVRRDGMTLARSPRFTALLPRDGELNFSAVAYQNLGPVLGPLARQLKSITRDLPEEQLRIVEAIGSDTPASLAFAYGKNDQITVSSSSDGGVFSSGFALFHLQSLLDVQKSIAAASGEPAGG